MSENYQHLHVTVDSVHHLCTRQIERSDLLEIPSTKESCKTISSATPMLSTPGTIDRRWYHVPYARQMKSNAYHITINTETNPNFVESHMDKSGNMKHVRAYRSDAVDLASCREQ
jgi:hypothetical protein